MARIAPLAEPDMTAAQREVCAEAVSGKRGKIPAPMIAWLRNPELARRAQRLGELLRFDTTLEPRLSELAILMCGRHWTSHHEWTAHKRMALEAGLAARTIGAIAARRDPAFTDEREAIVYRVSKAMLEQGRMSDSLYGAALEALGEQGLVELVGVLGYYCMVSLTLNAFELGLPENRAPELEPSTSDVPP